MGHALKAMSSEWLLWAGGLIRRQEPRARQRASSLADGSVATMTAHHRDQSEPGARKDLCAAGRKWGRILPGPQQHPSSHLPLWLLSASSPSSQPHRGPTSGVLLAVTPACGGTQRCLQQSLKQPFSRPLQGSSKAIPRDPGPCLLPLYPLHPPVPAITEPLASTQTIIPLPWSSVAPRPPPHRQLLSLFRLYLYGTASCLPSSHLRISQKSSEGKS